MDDYVDLQNAKKDEPADQAIVISRNAPREGVGANPNEKSREAYILGATANSDLIVVAEPLLRKSAATGETRRFIFSDYEVVINRIFLARNIQRVVPAKRLSSQDRAGFFNIVGGRWLVLVPNSGLLSLNTT